MGKKTGSCLLCGRAPNHKVLGDRAHLLCGDCFEKQERWFGEKDLAPALDAAFDAAGRRKRKGQNKKRGKKVNLYVVELKRLAQKARCDVCRAPLGRLHCQPIEACDTCVEALPDDPVEALKSLVAARELSGSHDWHMPIALKTAMGELTEGQAQDLSARFVESGGVPHIYSSPESKPAKSKKASRKKSTKKPRCKVCRNLAGRHGLCGVCRRNFFKAHLDQEIPGILSSAEVLAQEEELSLGLAINVARGLYSVRIAKEKQRAKNSEKEGKGDIYTQGRRLSGSFGAGKKS